MFKVMLVDDEKMVRKGIRMSIDWQRYGVVIASEARDGAEALEKLREEPVDLILSDIRMPVMSGIELARTVKQQYPDVEMVLLSGYEDFACAKEAMALGIRHYLLKPVLADNLVETVSGLRDEEKERRLRRQGEQLRGQLLRASAPLLKSRLGRGDAGRQDRPAGASRAGAAAGHGAGRASLCRIRGRSGRLPAAAGTSHSLGAGRLRICLAEHRRGNARRSPGKPGLHNGDPPWQARRNPPYAEREAFFGCIGTGRGKCPCLSGRFHCGWRLSAGLRS
nr:response regulator [Paenibacillus sp. P22]